MIPFNFEYYQPQTLREATSLYQTLKSKGKQPMYYSGGTEIITLGRINHLYTDAVIDIKGIAECRSHEKSDDYYFVGAAVTLSEINDVAIFPLLVQTGSEIADRTSRNKITLGGNICGQIFYREAVLPLLITDTFVQIAGSHGIRWQPLTQIFDQYPRLQEGELIVQFAIEIRETKRPFYQRKIRKQGDIGYPLITINAVEKKEAIQIALSGLCPYPFRAKSLEELINGSYSRITEEQIKSALPADVLTDSEGSADYRLFLLNQQLKVILQKWGGYHVDHE